jgi:hypothetical protein
MFQQAPAQLRRILGQMHALAQMRRSHRHVFAARTPTRPLASKKDARNRD